LLRVPSETGHLMSIHSNKTVVLVDSAGRETGTCDKLVAHREGKRHLAFSVFLFNSSGAWLLQKRAADKYHSGGLWSNACCSHPGPNANLQHAARRRLQEEMGIDSECTEAFVFTYEAQLNNGLIESEVDHVFIGSFDGDPAPDPGEVAEWKWMTAGNLRTDLAQHPDIYTPWFAALFDKVLEHVIR
jgi:isopentenyl-diphosphate delta-isomerase